MINKKKNRKNFQKKRRINFYNEMCMSLKRREGVIVETTAYLIALQQAPGIGSIRAKYLLEYFGEVQKIWSAEEDEIKKVFQFSKELASTFINYRKTADVEKLYYKVQASGCWVSTIIDDDYPPVLKQIHDPPIVIYGKGRKELLKSRGIAMVGCRKPSYYGQQMAKKISGDLADYHWTVISGLARGIDASSHKGCLEKQGNTVAVLGSGVDVIYPPENNKLYHEILEKGAVITEYPPGSKPVPGNFPARNRIISGLALGVVVIEAGEKSGSLITADFAMEQGKDVFALPGLITNPAAKGTHNLIKQGAKLIESVIDIVEEYYQDRLFLGSFGNSKKEIIYSENDLTNIEGQIIQLIKNQPLHIDEICQLLNKSIVDINPMILKLEMKGLAIQLPGKIISYPL